MTWLEGRRIESGPRRHLREAHTLPISATGAPSSCRSRTSAERTPPAPAMTPATAARRCTNRTGEAPAGRIDLEMDPYSRPGGAAGAHRLAVARQLLCVVTYARR